MNRWTLLTAFVAVASLLAPGIAATQSPTPAGDLASFIARSVSLEGEGRAEGPLAAFQLGTTPNYYPSPEPAGLFRLTAERIDIRVIHYKRDIGNGVAPMGQANVTNSYHRHNESQVAFDAPWDTFEFYIIPDPRSGATITTGLRSGSATASATTEVAVKNKWQNERIEGFTSRTQDAVGLAWTNSPTDLEIRGDFGLSLWNWNFTIDNFDNGTSQSYFTGEKSTEVTPPVATLTGVRKDVHRQHALLRVTNGTLSFLRQPTNGGLLLVNGLDVAGAGDWNLEDAEGHLADGKALQPAAAPQIRLTGQLGVHIGSAQEDRLATQWSGRPDRVDVGDVAVAWAAPLSPALAANTLGLPWWGWVGAVIAAASVGLLGRRIHITRERSRMRTLELLSRIRDDDRALKVAETLLKSPAFRLDAAILKTEALVRKGRLDEAGQFVNKDCQWMDPACGVREYLQALVAAHVGDREAAALYLGRALANAPEYRSEVLRTPVFQLVRSDPRVARFLRGSKATALPDGYS